jgi:glucan phosphoethanolaminetransferase (alkaline phosphatase superfamily)
MVKALNQRHGWPGSIFAFLVAEGLLFLCYMWPVYNTSYIFNLLEANGMDTKGIFSALPFLFYIIGLFFINLYALFNLRDIRRWFPAKAK